MLKLCVLNILLNLDFRSNASPWALCPNLKLSPITISDGLCFLIIYFLAKSTASIFDKTSVKSSSSTISTPEFFHRAIFALYGRSQGIFDFVIV